MLVFLLNLKLEKLTCPKYNLPSDINLCLRISLFGTCQWTKPHKAKLPLELNQSFLFERGITWDGSIFQVLNDEAIIIELLQFSDSSKTALVIAQYRTYIYDFLFPVHLAERFAAKKETEIGSTKVLDLKEKMKLFKSIYPENFTQSIYLEKGEFMETYPKLDIEVSVNFEDNPLNFINNLQPCQTTTKTASCQTNARAMKPIIKYPTSKPVDKDMFKKLDTTKTYKRPPFVVRRVPSNIFSIEDFTKTDSNGIKVLTSRLRDLKKKSYLKQTPKRRLPQKCTPQQFKKPFLSPSTTHQIGKSGVKFAEVNDFKNKKGFKPATPDHESIKIVEEQERLKGCKTVEESRLPTDYQSPPSCHNDAFCVVCKLYRKYTRTPYWGHGRCRHGSSRRLSRSSQEKRIENYDTLSVSALLGNAFMKKGDTLKISNDVSLVSQIPTPAMQRIQLHQLMDELEKRIR